MHLREVNQAFDHRITGGGEYGWECWENARMIDYSSLHGSATAVFNSVTQRVYEVTVVSDTNPALRPYRWQDPEFKGSNQLDALARGVNNAIAWDDVKWYDLEVTDDFFEKATAIFAGKKFDERVQVPIDLSDEDFIRLAKEAHRQDVTFNKMVEQVLQSVINSYKDQNEETSDSSGSGCTGKCGGCTT